MIKNEAYLMRWRFKISDTDARQISKLFTIFWKDRNIDEFEFTVPCILKGDSYNNARKEIKDGYEVRTSRVKSVRRINRDLEVIQAKIVPNPLPDLSYSDAGEFMCAETTSGSKYYFHSERGLCGNDTEVSLGKLLEYPHTDGPNKPSILKRLIKRITLF